MAVAIATGPLTARGDPATSSHERPVVSLVLASDLATCLGDEPIVVRDVAAIELGGLLVPGERPGSTRVTVGCTDGVVFIAVDDPITGKTLGRRLALDDLKGGRARATGLAAAELVMASWVELAVAPPRASSPARAAAAALVQGRLDRSPRTAPRWSAHAGTMARMTGDLTLFGSVFAAEVRLGRHWRVALDAVLERGTADLGLSTAIMTVASSAPRVVIAANLLGVELRAGAGWRTGIAHFNARRPVVSGAVVRPFDAPWGGPIGSAELRAGWRDRIALSVGAEAGYTLLEVHARSLDKPGVALDGTWLELAATLGVVW